MMMINQKLPLKSISIICCFHQINDTAILQLENLQKLIHSFPADVEIVLVTLSSNVSKVSKYVDKIVNDEGKGIYHAMNLGLENSSNDYVNFNNLGDDLYFIPELCGEFDLYAFAANIYRDDRREYTRYPCMKNRRMPCHQAIFTRRNAHELFNIKLRFSADLDFYLNFNGTKKYFRKAICKFNLGGVSNLFRTIPRRKFERIMILFKYYSKMLLIKTVKQSKRVT